MKTKKPNTVVLPKEDCTLEMMMFAKNVFGDVTVTRLDIENEIMFEFTNNLGYNAFRTKFGVK